MSDLVTLSPDEARDLAIYGIAVRIGGIRIDPWQFFPWSIEELSPLPVFNSQAE